MFCQPWIWRHLKSLNIPHKILSMIIPIFLWNEKDQKETPTGIVGGKADRDTHRWLNQIYSSIKCKMSLSSWAPLKLNYALLSIVKSGRLFFQRHLFTDRAKRGCCCSDQSLLIMVVYFWSKTKALLIPPPLWVYIPSLFCQDNHYLQEGNYFRAEWIFLPCLSAKLGKILTKTEHFRAQSLARNR